MSVFKLMLCLAGLGIYLVVKQFVVARPAVDASGSDAVKQSSSPATSPEQPAEPRSKPQTAPHTELLKSHRGWVLNAAYAHG